jgi:TPR repeat protein
MSRLIACLALVLLLASPAAARADYDAGEEAYNNQQWIAAIANLRPIAESDDRAAYLLGKMYLDGDGVVPDSETAMKLYRTSAAKGNINAMVSIGAIFQGGIGYARDFKLARIWFKRAAEAGSQFAAFVYATSLFQGDYTGKTDLKPDDAEAYKWLRIATISGNYPKVKEAALAAAAAAANRLKPEEVARLNKAAAAWKPTDISQLGPLPADVKPAEK